MANHYLPSAVAEAAAQTDMNVPDSSAPVPHNGEHRAAPAGPDLSSLTPQEVAKHHARQLYGVVRWDGLNGAAAYKEKHPEAAQVVVKAHAATFIPKPPGYDAAVSQIVGGWLTEDAAAERTNRQDVTTLNASVGGSRFNPNNHFSKPIGAQQRARLKQLFAARGFLLPVEADTLSKVKRAAKAARAGTLPGADAFGSIGTLANGLLSIGGASFAVERHGPHDCIRLPVNGDRVRIRVDAIREFLMLTGLLRDAGTTPSSTNVVSGRTGPQVQFEQENDPLADTLPENWSRSSTTTGAEDQSPGELDPGAALISPLEQKIDSLIAAQRELERKREARLSFPPDRDPLEFTDEEEAAWRAEQIGLKDTQGGAPTG